MTEVNKKKLVIWGGVAVAVLMALVLGIIALAGGFSGGGNGGGGGGANAPLKIKDGVAVNFANYYDMGALTSSEITVADYINGNNATNVTYTVASNNQAIATVSAITSGSFTVSNTGIGTTTVVLKALQNSTDKVTVNFAVTVGGTLPTTAETFNERAWATVLANTLGEISKTDRKMTSTTVTTMTNTRTNFQQSTGIMITNMENSMTSKIEGLKQQNTVIFGAMVTVMGLTGGYLALNGTTSIGPNTTETFSNLNAGKIYGYTKPESTWLRDAGIDGTEQAFYQSFGLSDILNLLTDNLSYFTANATATQFTLKAASRTAIKDAYNLLSPSDSYTAITGFTIDISADGKITGYLIVGTKTVNDEEEPFTPRIYNISAGTTLTYNTATITLPQV
jgi:hypothetical protein